MSVVAVAAVVASGAVLVFAMFSCIKLRSRRKPRMEDQLNQPMSTKKRPKFKYSTYRESLRPVRAAATKPTGTGRQKVLGRDVIILNTDVNNLDISLETVDDQDSVARNDGEYMDVSTSASPGSAALAFARFETGTGGAGAAGRQLQLPTLGVMSPTSRANPLFDAATISVVFEANDDETEVWDDLGESDSKDGDGGESDFGGDTVFDFDAPADAGYGFGENFTETAILAAVREDLDLAGFGFDDEAETDAGSEPPGTGTPLHPEVLAMFQSQMDEALEALNTPTEVVVRTVSIQRICALLERDPVCIQECVDMNGVLSIVSAIKEDTDVHLQLAGIQALNVLCDDDTALTEILQYHTMSFLGYALECEALWREALLGLVKAARSKTAVHLMISEMILPRLCKRLPFASLEEQTRILAVFLAIASTAERLPKLEGMFVALASAMGNQTNRESMLDATLHVITAATASFGDDATAKIKWSGLASELKALPNNLVNENATLRTVLSNLED